jgi:hypothetical protein
MKWISVVLLAVALGGGSGCTQPFLHQEPPPKVELKLPPPAPPSVTPDSVNAQNAEERARALNEELHYEAVPRTAAAAETKGN